MRRIILASQSIGRKSLMERSGLPFEVMISDYEEDHSLSNDPYELVKLLALGKAESIASKVSDAIIIGADTIVIYGDRVIGKPRDRSEAFNQIKLLSGNTHSLITGMAVIDAESGVVETDVSETMVKFSELSDEEINDYLDRIDYQRLAGSYAIDGCTMLFIEGIDGSHTNVVGLPMNKLAVILKKMGVNVFKQ